jgi:hypothetical protein
MFGPRKPVFGLVLSVVMAAILSANARQVDGQGGLVVEDAAVSVDFGRTITFQARIQAPLPIKQASILFRGVNEEVTHVETVRVAEDGAVKFIYDASLDVHPPFSLIAFWFQATLADDRTYTSAPITFSYNDNRFPWRETGHANITVHWYAGDDAFGTAALDAAENGMPAINEVLPEALENPVDIYIYSNIEDLKTTMGPGGEPWTGGHAAPRVGVVLVAIEPGENQSIELGMKIPHELAHLLLYRALGDGYARQPAWLLEGFASMVELSPNSEYALALQNAGEKDSLLAFEDICVSFPADAGNAFLAYAQSRSFVTYIRNTYGNAGLARLIESYRDGYNDRFNCELGATNALGRPLSQLDRDWRETLPGQNKSAAALRSLAPFMILMALALIVPILGRIDMVRKRRERGKQTE